MASIVHARKALCLAVVVLAATAGTAGAVHAQTFMASVIGNAVGNAVAQGQEAACQKGIGIPPDPWPTTEAAKLDDVVAQFAAASAKGDARAIKALFASGSKSGVADVEGKVSPRGAGLPEWTGAAKLERRSLLFGADAHAARTQWQAGQDELFYTIDFVHGNWGGGWKILRVRASHTETPAEPLEFFCHIDNLAALW